MDRVYGPTLNLERVIGGMRMELGMVVSMRVSRERKPQSLAMRAWSSSKVELWHQEKVLLGQSDAIEIYQDC